MENIYNLKGFTEKYNKNSKQIFSYNSNMVGSTKNSNNKSKSKNILYNSKSLEKKNFKRDNGIFDLGLDRKNTKENPLKISMVKYSSPVKRGPFDKNKKSSFNFYYESGSIPVKLIHGNVNLKLIWEKLPSDLNYDPLLVICFEGLNQICHPFGFLAYQTSVDLLTAINAKNKVIPLLPKLAKILRDIFKSENQTVILKAIEITKILSDLTKEEFNKYVKLFIQSINKLAVEM